MEQPIDTSDQEAVQERVDVLRRRMDGYRLDAHADEDNLRQMEREFARLARFSTPLGLAARTAYTQLVRHHDYLVELYVQDWHEFSRITGETVEQSDAADRAIEAYDTTPYNDDAGWGLPFPSHPDGDSAQLIEQVGGPDDGTPIMSETSFRKEDV